MRENGARAVRLIAEQEYVSTLQGQHMLFLLVDLLSRQFGVVGHIHLDVANVPTHEPYRQMGGDVAGAALNIVASNSQGRIEASRGKGQDVACTVSVGFATGFQDEVVTYGWSDGWNVYVGRNVLQVPYTNGSIPLGPYFGACVLASEVFKRIGCLNERFGKFAYTFYYSLWTGQEYSSLDDMPRGQALSKVELPELVIVGLGAVGQAVSLVLGMMADILTIPPIILIDGDHYDSTNHNRCVLGDGKDVKQKTKKVQIAERFLMSRDIVVRTYDGTWEKFVFESPDRNTDFQYEWVLSCVDNNVARHSIQQLWPHFILGGSTVNMTSNVTLYERGSGFECMKCYNQPEENPESPEELRNALLQKDEEQFLRLCQKAGADPTLVMDYLKTAQCGSLGEAEIRKFESTTIEPSVGFVSVAAGVLVVSQLLRCLTSGVNEAFPNAHNLYFSLLKLGHTSYPALANPECDCRSQYFQ